MEYKFWYLSILALVAFFLWSMDYFGFFRKSKLYYPNTNSIKSSSFLKGLFFVLGAIAWFNIGMALMQPRKQVGFQEDKVEVNDVFFVVDVSRSMIAADFKPNRLEAAKSKIIEFVDLIPKDRIGIIAFADDAFTLLPLSTDLKLVKEMVADIRIGLVGNGTNIGDALGLAVARGIQSLAKNKVIILLTDGVSNVGSLTPLQAAEEAAKAKMKVYTIGIGGDKDAKIKLGGRIQLIPGGSIDLPTLREISKITGGKSYVAKDSKALESVLSDIERLERTEINQTGKAIYKEEYYKYLLLGIILLSFVSVSRKFILREVL